MTRHLLQTGGWALVSLFVITCFTPLSGAEPGDGGGSNSMRFAPYDYSPYHSEPSWAPPKEQLAVPYSQPQQPPVYEAPPVKRSYEMLPPSGRGYYSYGQPYYGGGYPGSGYGSFPSWGNMWPGSGGGWGGMPWRSPGSFSWFGGPGGFPFGW